MKSHMMTSILFWISCIYDGLLGLAFLFFSMKIFETYQITPPNHIGYIQFPAAILLLFAIMFAAIARDPIANKNMIPYGILLKLSYCAVVFGHWMMQDLPGIWKPFAICDAIFVVLFAVAYTKLK